MSGGAVIESPHHSSRGDQRVRLVVLHTAEGALTTTSLGRFFARPDVRASSHVGIDDRSIVQYVPYNRAAWTLRSGNRISDNAELCGFAAWTRDQWVADHHPMLELAAAWIRNRCAARAIPVRKLTVKEIRDGKPGVIGHVDWTNAMNDGTHSDPGAAFPWDVVMALASGDLPDPTPKLPVLRYGDRSEQVRRLQEFLTRVFPTYATFQPTGFYGDQTKGAVREFQRRARVQGSPLNGEIVGPATNYELAKHGYRG
jgi:N-acetyl-anhydromuramyl-L-alanine amidase AmpD